MTPAICPDCGGIKVEVVRLSTLERRYKTGHSAEYRCRDCMFTWTDDSVEGPRPAPTPSPRLDLADEEDPG